MHKFLPTSKFYRYTLRRCDVCTLYAECIKRGTWGDSTYLDCGRCGCKKFHSDDEKVMAEKAKTCKDE